MSSDLIATALSPDGSKLLHYYDSGLSVILTVQDIGSTEQHQLVEVGDNGARSWAFRVSNVWASNDTVFVPTSQTGGELLRLEIPPLPTPTPVPANPQTSDSPVAIAEGFYLASLARAEAGSGAPPPSGWYDYFAPDRRPDPDEFFFSLLATCRGVAYETVERQAVSSGVPYAEVTLLFPLQCPRDGDDVEGFVVYLERGTGRWHVYDAEVLAT